MTAERFPEHLMEFVPEYAEPVPEAWQPFFDMRESVCLNYGYNTGRAYWADFQDWAVLSLTEKDQRQYYALLRRRKYSESTTRRRGTAMRLLQAAAEKTSLRTGLGGRL